ncbi:MAG: Sulfate transport system permease protein CysW [Firmicutes bacterium ADurb.Bin356]|nr:MAG: Sulfate transport system permease protein CysW [Firmicutes bacterium ADurb.Bin356]
MANAAKIIEMLFGSNSELRQIVGLTLQMSFLSTLISALLGVFFGLLIASKEFRLKRPLLRLANTLMSTPSVLCGLLVFLLLSRSGPLGSLGLLFSLTSMVIAQVLLITPVITSLCAAAFESRWAQIRETAIGMGLPYSKQLFYTFLELRNQLIAIVLMGFGRAISEVGSVSIVGGNIQFKTRVMTTAIAMVVNMGDFNFAIALGIVLLLIAFTVNAIANRLRQD